MSYRVKVVRVEVRLGLRVVLLPEVPERPMFCHVSREFSKQNIMTRRSWVFTATASGSPATGS